MSTLTENYGLIKPSQKEFYNVNVFNENADKIDKELKTAAKGEGLVFSVVNGILCVTYNESGVTL